MIDLTLFGSSLLRNECDLINNKFTLFITKRVLCVAGSFKKALSTKTARARFQLEFKPVNQDLLV